jgi:mannitol/fructose-specific phosphotransferase system IIA component
MREYNLRRRFVEKAEKIAAKKAEIIAEQIAIQEVLSKLNINDEYIIKLILSLYGSEAEFLDVVRELQDIYKLSEKSISQQIKRLKWIKRFKDTYVFNLKIKL